MSYRASTHITGCGVIHTLQQYSFKTGGDLKQYAVLVASQNFVLYATRLMMPYRTA